MSIYIIGGRRIIPYDVILEKKEREIEKEVAKYSFPHVTQESIRIALLFSKIEHFMLYELFEPIRFKISHHSIDWTYSFHFKHLKKRCASLSLFHQLIRKIPKQYFNAPRQQMLYRVIREQSLFFNQLLQTWKTHIKFVEKHREFQVISSITFPNDIIDCMRNRLTAGSLFETGEQLGKGSYGTVFASSDRKYVIKDIPDRRKGLTEASIGLLVRRATRPHYVLIERKEGAYSTKLVFERITRPTLDQTYSSPELWDTLREVLLSLQEIHHKGLVHCDVKPANIMGKLIDFSYLHFVGHKRSRFVEATRHPKAAYFSLNNTIITLFTQMDTWALGCTLYKIMFGSYPSDKYPNPTLASHVAIGAEMYKRKGEFRAWLKNHLFAPHYISFVPLIYDLLEPDETKALSVDALLEKYFRDAS